MVIRKMFRSFNVKKNPIFVITNYNNGQHVFVYELYNIF